MKKRRSMLILSPLPAPQLTPQRKRLAGSTRSASSIQMRPSRRSSRALSLSLIMAFFRSFGSQLNILSILIAPAPLWRRRRGSSQCHDTPHLWSSSWLWQNREPANRKAARVVVHLEGPMLSASAMFFSICRNSHRDPAQQNSSETGAQSQ